MTDAQEKGFYFPAWNKCAKANNWRMAGGRIVSAPQNNPLVPQLAQIWIYAQQLANLAQSPVTPDALRHACHIVALGRDQTHKTFTTQQVNRVVDLFDMLADPDNLQARMNWENPGNRAKASLVAQIKRMAPDAYITAIAQSHHFPTPWESLAIEPLQYLFRLLKNRRPQFSRREGSLPSQRRPFSPRPAAGPKGITKLQYIKKNTTPAAPATTEKNPF